MSDELLKQEGYDLMGAAFEVHSVLGGGMAEEIYQEALEYELGLRNIPFLSKQGIRCTYKGHTLKKEYVPDLLASGELLVELKAVAKLLPEHLGQLMNYLHITGKRVGYLINFGPLEKLEWKRIIIGSEGKDHS